MTQLFPRGFAQGGCTGCHPAGRTRRQERGHGIDVGDAGRYQLAAGPHGWPEASRGGQDPDHDRDKSE